MHYIAFPSYCSKSHPISDPHWDSRQQLFSELGLRNFCLWPGVETFLQWGAQGPSAFLAKERNIREKKWIKHVQKLAYSISKKCTLGVEGRVGYSHYRSKVLFLQSDIGSPAVDTRCMLPNKPPEPPLELRTGKSRYFSNLSLSPLSSL